MKLEGPLNAAQRWREIRSPKKKIVSTRALSQASDGTIPKGSSSDQAHLRAHHLKLVAAAMTAKAFISTAELAETSVRSQREVVAALGRERMIGSNDLLDINFLELGISMGRAVGRIAIGSEMGTGLLVGPSLLMTNFHVLSSALEAARAVVRFDYQENNSGQISQFQDFRLSPNAFFVGDKDLDFTIVGVEFVSRTGRALSEYPWVKLIADLGKAEDGDSLNIIEHPRGGFKQIAFRNNTIITIPRERNDFLYYTTDTEPGSSGSPCFNDQWELVALHHSGVPDTNDLGQPLKVDGKPWVQDVDSPTLIRWVANEGVRISAIVKSIQSQPLKSEWRERVEELLTLSQPNPIESARSSSNGQSIMSMPQVGSKQMGSTGSSHTWNIPLQVTVTIGPVRGEREDVPAGKATIFMSDSVAEDEFAGREEKVVIDQDWSARPGFDRNFVGIEVPLPKLSFAMLRDTARVLPNFEITGMITSWPTTISAW